MPQLLVPIHIGAQIVSLSWYYIVFIVVGILLIPCLLAKCLEKIACKILGCLFNTIRRILCCIFCCGGDNEYTPVE